MLATEQTVLFCPECLTKKIYFTRPTTRRRNCWRCTSAMVTEEEYHQILKEKAENQKDVESDEVLANSKATKMREAIFGNHPASDWAPFSTDIGNNGELPVVESRIPATASTPATQPSPVEPLAAPAPTSLPVNNTDRIPNVDTDIQVFEMTVPFEKGWSKNSMMNPSNDDANEKDDLDDLINIDLGGEDIKPNENLIGPKSNSINTEENKSEVPFEMGPIEIDEIDGPINLAQDPFEKQTSEADKSQSEVQEFRFACVTCRSLNLGRTDQIGQMINCYECESRIKVPEPEIADLRPLGTFEEMESDAELKISDPVELPKTYAPLVDQELRRSINDEELESEMQRGDAPDLRRPTSRQSADSASQSEFNSNTPPKKKKVRPKSSADAKRPVAKSPRDPDAAEKKTQDLNESKNQYDFGLEDEIDLPKSTVEQDLLSTPSEVKDDLVQEPAETRSTTEEKPETKVDPYEEVLAPSIDSKKERFSYGELFGFLPDTNTGPRVAVVAFGIGLCIVMWQTIASYIAEGNVGNYLIAFFMGLLAVPCSLTMLGFCCSMGANIMERTAQGNLKITDWPPLEMGEWIGRTLTYGLAFGFGAAPMMLISFLLVSVPWYLYIASALVGLGAFVIGPPIILSMLDNESWKMPYSERIFGTFKTCGSSWQRFMMRSLLCLVVGLLCCGLFLPNVLVPNAIGAFLVTVVGAMYFRFFGDHTRTIFEEIRFMPKED